jgi:hypothetical protein
MWPPISPPASLLSLLFRLKYLEGISDHQVLAEELGVAHGTARLLEEKLTKLLESRIGKITPDRLELVCPECLSARVYEDPENGERVCGSCGAVLDHASFDESLPFDTTYALTSELAFDKSLGGTLNGKALMRVLAQSPSTEQLLKSCGNADLGLRARLIKVFVETDDPPVVKKAKVKAYGFSRMYGLEADYVFNNDVGKLLHQAYYLAQSIGEPSVLRNMAETCFWLCLIQHGRKGLACHFGREFKVNTKLVVAFKRAGEIRETFRNARLIPAYATYFLEASMQV